MGHLLRHQTPTKEPFCIIVLQHPYAFPVPHLAKLTIYFPLSESVFWGKKKGYTFGALFRSRQVVPPPLFFTNPTRYIGLCADAGGGGHFADEKKGAGALLYCGEWMWYSWEVHTWVPPWKEDIFLFSGKTGLWENLI